MSYRVDTNLDQQTRKDLRSWYETTLLNILKTGLKRVEKIGTLSLRQIDDISPEMLWANNIEGLDSHRLFKSQLIIWILLIPFRKRDKLMFVNSLPIR